MELLKDEQITLNIDGFVISQNLHNKATATSLFGITNKDNLNIGHDDRTWVLEKDIICDTCNRCVSCQTCNNCDGCVSSVGCNDKCQGCTGSCTGCASNCYESCFGDCYTCQDCQTGCTSCNACTAGCDGGCQTECYVCVSCDDCVGCNGECVGCFDGCQESCQNCTACANCTACVSCQTGCQTGCVTSIGTYGCKGCDDSDFSSSICITSCQTTCQLCTGCDNNCYNGGTICNGCTSGCQNGCQTGCQICTAGCQICVSCNGCTTCDGCVGCVGCTSCAGSCVSCNGCTICTDGCYSGCDGCQASDAGNVCSICTGSCQGSCQGSCDGCQTGCTTGSYCYTSQCGSNTGSCDSNTSGGDEGGDDGQEGDAIQPDCWFTNSGGFGKDPPTNSGSTEGNYDGEKNGPAPKSWLKSGKTQEQWDALSHEGVENYAKEHNLEIKPTDPKPGKDGKSFVGPKIKAVNQALGLNGKGQPPTNYHIDYKYNPETGLNEGDIIGEDGKVLGKITQTPGSNKFKIENYNPPKGAESETSEVEVDQETGDTGDPETETLYGDGSKTKRTKDGTKYVGPDGKENDTAGC